MRRAAARAAADARCAGSGGARRSATGRSSMRPASSPRWRMRNGERVSGMVGRPWRLRPAVVPISGAADFTAFEQPGLGSRRDRLPRDRDRGRQPAGDRDADPGDRSGRPAPLRGLLADRRLRQRAGPARRAAGHAAARGAVAGCVRGTSGSDRTSATGGRTCRRRRTRSRPTAVEVLASSSVYETEPVGEVLDQPDFYNACLRVRTALDARGAARRLQGGRARAGQDRRRRSPRAAPDRRRPAAARGRDVPFRAPDAPARAGREPPLRAHAAGRALAGPGHPRRRACRGRAGGAGGRGGGASGGGAAGRRRTSTAALRGRSGLAAPRRRRGAERPHRGGAPMSGNDRTDFRSPSRARVATSCHAASGDGVGNDR